MNRMVSSLISAAAMTVIATQSLVALAAREVETCGFFNAQPQPIFDEPCGLEGFGDTENSWVGEGVGSLWRYNTDLNLSEGFEVAAGMSLLQGNGQRVTQQGSVVLCPEAADTNPTKDVVSFRATCSVGQLVQGIHVVLARTT